jgi:L-alanine-DL-glutamate epimerase-like enolase superfamily enzyme
MKIVDVKSTIADLRRRRALKTAYGGEPLATSTAIIVQVYTDEGITGIGQTLTAAPLYGDTAEAIKVNIDKYLRAAIVGEDPFNIEYLFDRMVRSLRGTYYPITAIEFALWDIKGKALNVPVYQLLGGKVNEGAPLHAFVERQSVEETSARILELADEGWRWFKTKIGFGVREDVDWYAAVREKVGDEIRFQVDGNIGYTLGEAIQALTTMEQIGGLALVEQPVHYLDEMAVLASRLVTPVQADEALTGPRSVYEIARARAAHVLHFKIEKYGGLLQAKRMAAIAEAAGLELSVAPYFDFSAAAGAHFAASTPNVRWPAGFSDMEDTLLTEPYLPENQVSTPPEGPGLGVELDEDKLAAYGARWQ